MNSKNINGFSGSVALYNKAKDLIDQYNVQTAIETGTFEGYTSTLLSEMVEHVITIEKYENQAEIALNNKLNDINNVDLLIGDSSERLVDAIDMADGPILFYLDAHSPDENPIRDELRVIANHYDKKLIIVVHDIKNPHREDLGYNQYNDGTELTWSYICDLIGEIYQGEYSVSFNNNAPSDERGVAFVESR